jgi:hypothetical protein
MKLPAMYQNKIIYFICLFVASQLLCEESEAQDSLRARAYDNNVKESFTGRTLTRRDIINDTITFYFYHPETTVFTSVTEYPRNNKGKLEYHYRFDSTGLRRATILKRRGFAKDLYAVYYFENNTVCYKESHGLPLEQEAYLLKKGMYFFESATERFKGPKLN